jgi:hypothetical protein
MATCKSCQAPILWVRVKNTGSLMPVDAKPNPKGNVEVEAGEPERGVGYGGYVYRAVVHGQPPMMVAGTLHMPHHATCPQADQWRRRG